MAYPHFVWYEIFFLTSIQRKKEAKLIVDQEIISKNQAELNAPGDTWRMARLCFHRVTATGSAPSLRSLGKSGERRDIPHFSFDAAKVKLYCWASRILLQW